MSNKTFEPVTGFKRTAYFDYLKVLVYFLMILVHTASYRWYSTDVYSLSWLVLNFYKSTFRSVVLPFFMVSGALSLGKDIPIGKIYKKYVLRLAVVFIFWDILYAVITYWNEGPSGIIFKIFNSNYHLWYLLAAIGLYICFPLIRMIAKDKKISRYFLILSFIFAFLLPTIFNLIGEFGSGSFAHYSYILSGHFYDMHMHVVMGYPFFFIAGYYIHTYGIGKILRRIIYVLGIISALAGFLVNTLYVRMIHEPLDTFENSFMLYEMIPAIALFTFFRYNVRGNAVLDKFCFRISKWGLGIYMLHDLVLLGLNSFFGLNAMTFNPIIAVPVVAIITFALSALISALLNLIPWVKDHLV